MSGRRRPGLPDPPRLLGMMGVNALLALGVLALVTMLFGLRVFLPPIPAVAHLTGAAPYWMFLGAMAPGAGVGFGCLWYWLILVGRTHGVSWGGACVYGVLIALADVPMAGLILGAQQGRPLLGLLLGLALLLLLPSFLLAVSLFGTIMGLFNGWAAQEWLEAYRRGR